MNCVLIFALFVVSIYSTGLRKTPEEDRWMLTDNEITESRGGYERFNISRFARGNQIEYLIDGQDIMKAVYDDIIKTKKGDYIHATFFEEDTKVMFMPNSSNPEESEKTSLHNLVKEATKRGVTVRILANFNLFHSYLAIPFCWDLNTVCGYTCCGMESRHHNWILGNLHTKMWVIKHDNETIAYNGGMDITDGRWDTHYHDNSPERIMDFDFLNIDSMHDVFYRMRGPIVKDIAYHFYQRWNDPYPAFFPFQYLPKFEWDNPNFPAPVENGITLQLLRTAACKGAQNGYYSNFAPKGETSSYSAFFKMIENAKKFIYLEDQFLTLPSIFTKIRNKLKAKELEYLIIITNNQTTPTLLSTQRFYFQYRSLKQFLINGTDQLMDGVHIFQMVRETNPNENLYLHSKVFIADDEFMIGGSFGIEQVSLTSDLDIGLGVYDPHYNFIKSVRKRVWAEHLMLLPDDPRLDDPMTALQLWLDEADKPMRRVKTYFPKRVDQSFINDFVYEFFENTGRCE